jgi:DNA-binding SARP family transcriptional activator/WD40 repeat protein
MIELRSLGSLGVFVDGHEVPIGGSRQRRLLAMLLIHRGQVVSVDRLAEAVFAGEPTDAAATTLRSYVARMRRVLDGGDVEVVTKAPGYLLHAADDRVDAGRFEELLDVGRRQSAGGEPALAVTTLHHAIELWRGPALAEFADEEWAMTEAQRLEELRLVALERLAEAELACGRAAEAIPMLEQLVAEHPLREAFRMQHMLALYRTGRQVDALRAYQSFRSILIEEVGVEPSPALADLQRRILDHDPSLDVAAGGEPLRGYRLGQRLGTGPNGTMYVATVEGGVHERVISILDDPIVDDLDFVRTFEANASLIAALTHPGLVPLHDYWRQPGTAYVVTRRPLGGTLRERLRSEPMALDEIVALATRVGGALAEAEARGVQHGWVTLDNVVVDGGAFAITNFVVCPRVPPHDAGDFATVLRACVEVAQPPVTGARRVAVDAALDDTAAGVAHLVTRFTQALVSAGDTDLTLPRPNPFRGLRPFDENDSDEFFGRDALVDALLARVLDRDLHGALTMVVGGSGSGKSSLVRAGLVPRVRQLAGAGHAPWFVTTMLPGGTPFKELAEALRRVAVCDVPMLAAELRNGARSLSDAVRAVLPAGGRLLLVIDQFEELYTLTGDADQLAFLDMLARAAEDSGGAVHVLGTLRADFYDRPLASGRFGPFVGPATVAVAAMTPSELEAAIVRPVERCGATVEPALVAELVAAVGDRAGALPGLQFTLFELAERRADRCLTLDDYRVLGGLDQAIAVRAESVYRSLDPTGRRLLRALFGRLVVVDPSAEATGRRTSRAELTQGGEGEATRAVIEQMTSARLLTVDHDPQTRVPTVQVAHEALLRSWPRLQQWIVEDRDAIVETHLRREAAAAWEREARDEGALLRGARLERALDLTEDERDALPQVERDFLDASEAARDREQEEIERRIAEQARANRRLRLQVAVIAVALVMAMVVGFLAVEQRGQAREERDAADRAGRNATARELASAAAANVEVDPERAIHLAMRAVEVTRSVDGTVIAEAVDALHRAVTANRVVVNVPDVGGRLDWDPTGDEFVTEGPEESGMVDIRSATTGESLRSWRGDEVDVNEVRYSSDGTKLAVAGDDGTLKVFDPQSGELISSVAGTGTVWDPSFDAAGDLLLAQWIDEEAIRLVDASTGDVIGEVEGRVTHLDLSPDGRFVALANAFDASGVAVVDVATQELRFVAESDDWIGRVRWSPDGVMVAAVDLRGLLRVYDAATGELVAAVQAHPAQSFAVEWSRDGAMLATGSYDGTARVWRLGDRYLEPVARVSTQDFANGTPGLAFSPDGDRLAVSDWAITSTKVVDIRPEGLPEVANLEAEPWRAAAFRGDELFFVDPDDGVARTVVIGDGVTTGNGTPERRLGVRSVGWPGLVMDDAGERIAVYDEQASLLEIRDAETGSVLHEHDLGDEAALEAVAWNPAGDRIVYARSTDEGRSAEVIVAETSGEVLASTALDGMAVANVTFSSDGERVAFAASLRQRVDPSVDGIVVWDWRSGDSQRIAQLSNDVEFDRSGRFLAATRVNQRLADVYDADTLERVATLSGSESTFIRLVFGPDGLLATAGDDGAVRLWDAATGAELGSLRAPSPVTQLAFDEAGDRLLAIDETGVARVWTLDIDHLLAIAESRLTRELTDAECRRYLHAGC